MPAPFQFKIVKTPVVNALVVKGPTGATGPAGPPGGSGVLDYLSLNDSGLAEEMRIASQDGRLEYFPASGGSVKEIAVLNDLANYVQTSVMQAYAQPLDSDLTAIAALSTTSYGRNLLTLANQAALQAAVGATGGTWGSITGTLASQTDLQSALDAKASLSGTTFTGQVTNSKAGTASSPALLVTGTPFAGTGTTSFPQVYVAQSTATASTTLNTAGTAIGVNIAGSQDFCNFLVNGTSRFKLDSFGNQTNPNGSITVGAAIACASFFRFTSGSLILPTTNGIIVRDSSNTDFAGVFAFGGVTASFPALKKSGTTLQARLGDDSGFAPFAAASVTIGSGTAITRVLSATASLDFGSIAANSYADLTLTVTGAAVGDTVAIGVVNGSVPADVSFFAWVNATNTVTVRAANNSSTTARDPASGTFRATVTQF
jgi:hypothetical protein